MTTPDRTDAIARHLIATWVRVETAHVKDGEVNASFVATFADMARAILTTDDPAALAALADQWAEHHPDTLLDALTKAGVLDEDDDVEWCEERCYESIYDSPYTCGDRCNLAGPHERHECVDGHTWDVEPDDHHPKRSRRFVTDWREVTE